MRQLFVLISLVVLPLSACATIKLGANVGDNLSSDNYRPLLQDGKEWHYRLEMRDEENPSIHITKNCREMVAGDTIVGGFHYFKHYRDSGDGELRSSDALWREEGRKVFVRWNRNAEEELMYDFGVKVGDKFPEDDYLQVSCIDTVLVNGQYFRRMNLGRAVWVEGVGSNWSLSYPFGQQTTDGKKRTLTACKENGVTIFTEEDFNASGIADGIKNFSAAKHHAPAIYNLRGHRLTGKPTKGVYIEDGRKKMGK